MLTACLRYAHATNLSSIEQTIVAKVQGVLVS